MRNQKNMKNLFLKKQTLPKSCEVNCDYYTRVIVEKKKTQKC